MVRSRSAVNGFGNVALHGSGGFGGSWPVTNSTGVFGEDSWTRRARSSPLQPPGMAMSVTTARMEGCCCYPRDYSAIGSMALAVSPTAASGGECIRAYRARLSAGTCWPPYRPGSSMPMPQCSRIGANAGAIAKWPRVTRLLGEPFARQSRGKAGRCGGASRAVHRTGRGRHDPIRREKRPVRCCGIKQQTAVWPLSNKDCYLV